MAKVILEGYIVVPEQDLNMVLNELPNHIAQTRAESGCLVFQVEQDAEQSTRFLVYEEFVDQAAFNHHQARTKKSRWSEITANVDRYYQFLS